MPPVIGSRRSAAAGRFKHLSVGAPVPVETLRTPAKAKALSPRQLARLERDAEIKRALNEAAVAPESQAIPITPKANQKLAALRAAIVRVVKENGAAVNVGVRDGTIYLSRGKLPGRGGRRS